MEISNHQQRKREKKFERKEEENILGKRKWKPSLEIHFLRKKNVLFLHVSKEQAHNPIFEGKSL